MLWANNAPLGECRCYTTRVASAAPAASFKRRSRKAFDSFVGDPAQRLARIHGIRALTWPRRARSLL
jgi:hypothetical protein